MEDDDHKKACLGNKKVGTALDFARFTAQAFDFI